MIPTLILRHPKERLSKCSLEPLRGRADLVYVKATERVVLDVTGFILLAVDAPELSPEDAVVADDEMDALRKKVTLQGLPYTGQRPLLLLDSTWRLLYQLEACLRGTPIRRSLPGGLKTAYPRVSKIVEDPDAGLASVEALYLARKLLGDDDPTLLAHYHWRDAFLAQLAKPET